MASLDEQVVLRVHMQMAVLMAGKRLPVAWPCQLSKPCWAARNPLTMRKRTKVHAFPHDVFPDRNAHNRPKPLASLDNKALK